MGNLNMMLSGAGAMAALVIALFFLRFWRRTGDRFFVYFALSFAVEGGLRAYMSASGNSNDGSAMVYLLRVASYVLIVVAIVGKNRKRPAAPAADERRAERQP